MAKRPRKSDVEPLYCSFCGKYLEEPAIAARQHIWSTQVPTGFHRSQAEREEKCSPLDISLRSLAAKTPLQWRWRFRKEAEGRWDSIEEVQELAALRLYFAGNCGQGLPRTGDLWNMRISEKALQILELLTHDDYEDYPPELVCEKGVWMIGTKRVPRQIANELLLFSCISKDSFDKDFEHWRINGTGRDMLVDPVKICQQINALFRR